MKESHQTEYIRMVLRVRVGTILSLGLFYFTIVNVLRFTADSQIEELTDVVPPYTRTKCRPHASAWYGISAYPKISGSNESWEWILGFVDSISHQPLMSNSSLRLARSLTPPTINSIRYPSVKTRLFENTYLAQHLNLQYGSTKITPAIRYECGYPRCLATKRKLILRPEVLEQTITDDVVFIHALITDVYDLKRLTASIGNQATVLVTAITVYPSRTKEKEENFALPLYDFFHHVYFQLDWIPIHSIQFGCGDFQRRNKLGCQLWITWTKWDPQYPLRYLPPAGDGSPEMELQRLASFINHPQTDVCTVAQKIGGFRKSGSFIDGQYTVCLDSLRSRLASNTCLVYSFGVSLDWTFDEAMREIGCEVHSFDPSLGIPSHKRAAGHWFHAWGLASDVTLDPNWDLASYVEIRRRLGHAGRMVTVLKMDVEGPEWPFLRDSLSDNTILDSVEQFVVEIHPQSRFRTWRDVIRQRALLLYNLEKQGFVLFNVRQNVLGVDLRSVDFEAKLGLDTGNFLYELSLMKEVEK